MFVYYGHISDSKFWLNVFNTGAIDLRKKNQFPCFNLIKASYRVLNSRQADSIWTLKDKKLDYICVDFELG